MGNTGSNEKRFISPCTNRQEHLDTLAKIAAETGFKVSQVKTLWKRFCVLDDDASGFISRNELMQQIKGFQKNPLSDHIVDLFVKETKFAAERGELVLKEEFCEYSKKTEIVIPFMIFCKVLGSFNTTNCKDQEEAKKTKLRLLFSLYDKDGDGTVSKEEIINLLQKVALSKGECDQQHLDKLKAIVERALYEVDDNCDGEIDFEEFAEGLSRINLNERMTMRY